MAKLADLLDYQLLNSTSLSALLEKEKEAITSRIATDIEKLAKEKLDLINLLQQTDKRIADHPDVALLSDDPQFQEKVSQIKALITECQMANDVNGEALKRAQLSYNKLNNLMQQSQNKMGLTYTAGGRASNVSTLGTNIKA